MGNSERESWRGRSDLRRQVGGWKLRGKVGAEGLTFGARWREESWRGGSDLRRQVGARNKLARRVLSN